MIVEYTIGKIKEIYDNLLNKDAVLYNFPIIFSTSITLLFAAYLLLQ